MPPVTYLFFNGNCGEAMRAYERILGGKLEILTYGQSPEGCPQNVKHDRIMHAHLALKDGALMASDDESGQPYRGMSGFGVTLEFPKASETKRIFDALADGGRVTMPFGKTFWSEAFGGVIDRFGTPWMVTTAGPNAPLKH